MNMNSGWRNQYLRQKEKASRSAVATTISVVEDENGSQDVLPYTLSSTITTNLKEKDKEASQTCFGELQREWGKITIRLLTPSW